MLNKILKKILIEIILNKIITKNSENFKCSRRKIMKIFIQLQGVTGKFQDCASKNRTGFAIYKPSTVV